jgi:hypothetical protein
MLFGLRVTWNTKLHYVGKMQSSLMLKQVVRILTTVLWRVKTGEVIYNTGNEYMEQGGEPTD